MFLGSLESTECSVSNGTSRRANGQDEGAQTPCQRSKFAKVLEQSTSDHKAMKAYGNLGGKWEMGQESE
jgi:hypothetical protein